jgi:hypothetical protein
MMTDNDAIQDYIPYIPYRDKKFTDLQEQNKKLITMNAALIHSLEIRIREMIVLVEQMKVQLQVEIE